MFSTEDFGHKGKVYDGWETRRRREAGHDWAIVRLGVPGVVHGVVVDTAWFKGNYPPYVSVEATQHRGLPVGRGARSGRLGDPGREVAGQGRHRELRSTSATERRFTHVRLTIYPDGGVARFRVHGEPVPDPRFLTGTVDLAGLENGGTVVDCSNMFYSSPPQHPAARPGPDHGRGLGERPPPGRRQRPRDGARWRPGPVRRIEVDTSYFVGNAAGWASAARRRRRPPATSTTPATWVELVPKTRLQPDTRHFFRVRDPTRR